MRYADDLSQTAVAPCGSGVTTELLQEILRDRRERRYHQIDGRGITLVAGATGKFVGLLKTLAPFGILVRPSTAATLPIDRNPELICDMLPTTCSQHYNGWYPPGLPYALLCGMAARALSLASTARLAADSLTESLTSLITDAGYPPTIIWKLAKKWDDAHPGALLNCTSAAMKAYERAGLL